MELQQIGALLPVGLSALQPEAGTALQQLLLRQQI